MIERLISALRRPNWYWSLAVLMTTFYIATSLYISAHRLFWGDEILTVTISRLRDWDTVWKALSEGVDQTPPLYLLITRCFDMLFGHADLGVRVPSALALGAGLLVTFDIARRLTDGLGGLIATSLLTTSFVIYYGYDARPYAIYLLFGAIVLWVWMFTKAESKLAAATFGGLFLIGEAVHYYFFLCLIPFGLLALAERRLFNPKVFAGAAGIVVSLAVLRHQIASSRVIARLYPWTPPSLQKLDAFYVDFFPHVFLVLVPLAIGVAIFGRGGSRIVSSMGRDERVSWLFFSLPFVAYVGARLVTNFFNSRYMIGAVPGIVVALTCLWWRYCRDSNYLSIALLSAFCFFGGWRQLRTLKSVDHIQVQMVGDTQQDTRQMLALEETLQREGKRHFATGDIHLFLTSWYYSKHRERYEFVGSRPLRIFKYAAMSFKTVEETVANAEETAIIRPDEHLVEGLQRAGYHMKVRSSEPYIIYKE